MKLTITKSLISLLFIIAILALSACASTFGNNTRIIQVNSQPQGAAVYLNKIRVGTTPTYITLPTYIYGSNIVTVEADGYSSQSVPIQTSFQWIGLLNILNYGIGFLVDAATGDIIAIDSASLNVFVTLQPTTPPEKDFIIETVRLTN